MTDERARELTGEIHAWIARTLFGPMPKTPPPTFDLAEALEANERVRQMSPIDNGDGTKTLLCSCDPRIVAAIYVLSHFDAEQFPEPEPIVMGDGKALFLVELPKSQEEHEFVGDGCDCELCGEGSQYYLHTDRDDGQG